MQANQSSGIPVIGLVSAGGPILAEENIEKTIPNNPGILSHGVDFYLKVKGDSMVDVGIFENDLFAKGTRDLVSYLAKSNSNVIAGGGETIFAINKFSTTFLFIF